MDVKVCENNYQQHNRYNFAVWNPNSYLTLSRGVGGLYVGSPWRCRSRPFPPCSGWAPPFLPAGCVLWGDRWSPGLKYSVPSHTSLRHPSVCYLSLQHQPLVLTAGLSTVWPLLWGFSFLTNSVTVSTRHFILWRQVNCLVLINLCDIPCSCIMVLNPEIHVLLLFFDSMYSDSGISVQLSLWEQMLNKQLFWP